MTTAQTQPALIPVPLGPVNDAAPEDLDIVASELVAGGNEPRRLYVKVHAMRDDGFRPEVAHVPYLEYNETELSRRLPPGKYRSELRLQGSRGTRRQRDWMVEAGAAVGMASAPAASHATWQQPQQPYQPQQPMQGLPPFGMDPMTQFMAHRLAASEDRIQKLMEKFAERAAPTPVSPTSMISELVTTMAMIAKLGKSLNNGDGGGGGAGELAGLGSIVRDVVIGLKAGNQNIPLARETTPGAEAPPPPGVAKAQTRPTVEVVSEMLMLGARSKSPSPELYAGIVLDVIVQAGKDPKAELAQYEPGFFASALCAISPALEPHAAYVKDVERAMRESLKEAEEEKETDDDKAES